jgi:glutathione synthetase
LTEIVKVATFDSSNNLLIEGKIVSLFYFRAGYVEKDYLEEDNWEAREMIELCTAIKCPNMNTFLCTFKIFQYHLLKTENLKKYFTDDLIVNDLLRFFTKIFYVQDLNDEEKKSLFKEMASDVSKYIVKPQKEGGGNNFYNEDILKIIPTGEDVSQLGDVIKSAIVMERVYPPEFDAAILFENKCKISKCVSEVSVYGIVISDDNTIHNNKSLGFLLRTKEKNSQEGGVLIGSSAVDLPCLLDVKLDPKSNQPLSYDEY